MPLDLKELTHKVGPLPVWAWGVLAVGGIVVFERLHGSSSTSGTSSTTDPATGLTYQQEAQLEAEGIDPLTGQSIASEQASAAGGGYGGGFSSGGGGGWDSSGGTASGSATAPTSGTDLAGEIADITGLETALQGLSASFGVQAGGGTGTGPASQTQTQQAGPFAPPKVSGSLSALPVAAQIALVKSGLADASQLGPTASKVYAAGASSVAQYQGLSAPSGTGPAAAAPTPHAPATPVSASALGQAAQSVGRAVTTPPPAPKPVSRNKQLASEHNALVHAGAG